MLNNQTINNYNCGGRTMMEKSTEYECLLKGFQGKSVKEKI